MDSKCIFGGILQNNSQNHMQFELTSHVPFHSFGGSKFLSNRTGAPFSQYRYMQDESVEHVDADMYLVQNQPHQERERRKKEKFKNGAGIVGFPF